MRNPHLAIATLTVLAAPAAAHNGWSTYDETKPITLTGSFATVNWVNLHGSATMRWQGKEWWC